MPEEISGEEVLEAMRRTRGSVHPIHEYLAEHDPAYLAAYDTFASAALFGTHRKDPALPVRYRELIASALLAFRGASPAGVARHLARARQDGATDAEIMETFEAAALEGGGPVLAVGIEALIALDTEATS
jgi:alkylhydroperoxidase/carboxymuconolactone decarboxylase family protein YurZ